MVAAPDNPAAAVAVDVAVAAVAVAAAVTVAVAAVAAADAAAVVATTAVYLLGKLFEVKTVKACCKTLFSTLCT